jgi:hypothetical protein
MGKQVQIALQTKLPAIIYEKNLLSHVPSSQSILIAPSTIFCSLSDNNTLLFVFFPMDSEYFEQNSHLHFCRILHIICCRTARHNR